MKVASIRLINFRKFDDVSLTDLHMRLNVIIGPNARGKTSLLEGLSFATSLNSFRTSKAQEVIQNGKSQASITMDLEKPLICRIVVGLEEARRVVKVDEKVLPKAKFPYLGGSVSFGPDDLLLVKGGPESRRCFLDDLGVAIDPTYAKVVHKFERVLQQRNKILKLIKSGENRTEELTVWTHEFIESAVPLYEGRLHFIKILNQSLPSLYQELFQIEEKLSTDYKHSLPNEEHIRESLIEKLNQLSEAERAVGHGLVGPHRDDLIFKINGMDARTFASQGQIRGIVIALKVAQLELTRAYRTWSPLLLLDDIISELDDHRVHALVNYLSNYPGQLFVTTAEVNKVKALHSQFSGFKVIDLGPKVANPIEQIQIEKYA